MKEVSEETGLNNTQAFKLYLGFLYDSGLSEDELLVYAFSLPCPREREEFNLEFWRRRLELALLNFPIRLSLTLSREKHLALRVAAYYREELECGQQLAEGAAVEGA